MRIQLCSSHRIPIYRSFALTIFVLVMVMTFVFVPVFKPALADTGLDFPGSAAVSGTMRFKFSDVVANGLPIWGPGGNGLTYIWRCYPRRQNGYYTTFFWGNDDGVGTYESTFAWVDGIHADTYYGFHPYPYTYNDDDQYWEIATQQNDILIYPKGAVQFDRWFTQVAQVWADSNDYKHHKYYFDWPNTASGSYIEWVSTTTSWGERNPPYPTLTFGDAPWNPSNEIYDGILRGFQIYAGLLTPSDIQAELSSPLSTPAGQNSIWYLNTNPTPTDISDKSGRGHNPVWVGSERPRLYTSGTQYTITATAGVGGSISPSGNVVVSQGGSQTFAISANAGYQIQAVAVDGVNVGAMTAYTFTNVTTNHSIAATFSLSPPVDTLTMGETSVLGTDDSGNGNLLVAQQTTLSQSATINSLSFYVAAASGQLRLGVYADNGRGGPGALKAQTAEVTPVANSWNTAHVLAPIELPAGTYWLAYLPSSNSLHFRMSYSGSARYYSYTYGDMPSTFSSTPNAVAAHWSFYGTLEE
jgi:hypothetical protein